MSNLKLPTVRHPELVSGSLALLLLTLSIILFSCKTTQERERSYNKPYHKEDTELQAQLFLFHSNSNTSFLYYKLNNKQLLYKKLDTNSYFSARIRLSYKFMADANARQVLDSGTVFIEDKNKEQPAERDLIGSIPFRVTDGQDLYLEINLLDAFGKKSHTRYIHCDKRNAYSQQNFLFSDRDKNIFFSNKIEKGNTVFVNTRLGFIKARIDFFANDYSLPPPPFSQKEPNLYPSVPDSTFYVASTDEHNFSFKVMRQGVYYIRLDSSNFGGCTLLGVEQNFPKVQSHGQMIASSRFIMSMDEYQKLIDATDKQAAIEAFWLGLGGNQDRARQLIKRYYNRVQEANSFFTSHVEGWKTDMGMIYIVFGSPTKTYKTIGMETWVYGQEGNPNSVTFRFEKVNNPFSENCYKLQRGIQFKDPWYIAVGNWREGRVYLED